MSVPAPTLKADLDALRLEIGSKAHLSVGLTASDWANNKGPVSGAVYPKGVGVSSVALYVHTPDFDTIVEAMRAAWIKHRDLHASNLIKSMALAIIRLTAEHGECTDAALRADFDAAEVRDYADAAAAMATDMGGLGPFTVIKLTGANDMGIAA